MTEDEAKTKLCVHRIDNTHATQLTPQGYTTTVALPTEAKCVGSQCMAWRWNYTTKQVPKDLAEKAEAEGFKVIGYEVMALDVTYKMSKRLNSGYCGLAGKP